ncbi:hypothetical protein J6590_060226 [Homalodisca vitripennis]|nr:hypothetical protein J6590_060226 [Homalodisca vitripennis]
MDICGTSFAQVEVTNTEFATGCCRNGVSRIPYLAQALGTVAAARRKGVTRSVQKSQDTMLMLICLQQQDDCQ